MIKAIIIETLLASVIVGCSLAIVILVAQMIVDRKRGKSDDDIQGDSREDS